MKVLFAFPGLNRSIAPAVVRYFDFFGENDFDVVSVLSVRFHVEIFLLADQVAVLGVGQPRFALGEEDNPSGDEDDETCKEAEDDEADDLTSVEERVVVVDRLLHGDLQDLVAWMMEPLVVWREVIAVLVGE